MKTRCSLVSAADAAPAHLLLAAADPVLQHVVEALRPLGHVADAIAADVEVPEGLVVCAPMQVLAFEDDLDAKAHVLTSRCGIFNASCTPVLKYIRIKIHERSIGFALFWTGQ